MARVRSFGLAAAGALALAGCQFIRDDINRTLGRRPRTRPAGSTSPRARSRRSASTPICGARRSTRSPSRRSRRAISNGGVIVTEWYSNPQNPCERVKVTATILDRDLRADALRVTAARQTLQNGQWVDAPVTAATVQRLEEIILTRARDLRRAAIAG